MKNTPGSGHEYLGWVFGRPCAVQLGLVVLLLRCIRLTSAVIEDAVPQTFIRIVRDLTA